MKTLFVGVIVLYSQELLVQGANGQRPFSQLFTGSTIELLPELCPVASERRAEGFRQVASGEASKFKRVDLHPLETLQKYLQVNN
jgi:hypothetical protein